jgi:hypothetical protein
MRLLFGIILGVVITLGAAYLRDQTIPKGPTFPYYEQLTAQRVVNWDVLGAIVKEQTERARAEVNRFLDR